MKHASVIMIVALCVCVVLGSFVWTGCSGGTTNDTTAAAAETAANTASSADSQTPSAAFSGDYFSDSDYKDVSAETPNATITLDGSTGTISDTTRGSSGSQVTITSKGIYRVTGQSDGVSILVNETNKSGTVYLLLDGVTMTNEDACIDIEAADKAVVQCIGSSALESTNPEDAAILSRDDLTINGSGSLSLSSGKHGIVGKDEVRLTGGVLTINADSAGIKANDAVSIDGAYAEISSGHDGIQVDSDAGDGYFYISSGNVSINAEYDGIDVGTSEASEYTGHVTLSGGALTITAGGGSGNSKGSDSQKGLKCDGNIYIGDVSLKISSADDAVHSKANVYVSGGAAALSSSDDGISAYENLVISNGELTVSKSYEGLEAETVSISGGSVAVYASDDGINAAGGSDSTSSEAGPWSAGSATGVLTVSGGSLYVNADGDGLDSNGSIYISGGTVIVEGPSNSGNGALDKGDGSSCVLSITGGTVLAIGASDMAENFDAGTQCSALVSLSGKAGDIISVDDGSDFTFTASKSFACVVYSSPYLQEGNSYTISCGSESAVADFSGGLYDSNIASGAPQGRNMGGRP